MIKLTAYGAAEEVTGSKHMLDTDEARVLIDCGLFQGRRERSRQKNLELPFSASSVTACINTHGHLDHCGAYPLLVNKGFAGDILSTSPTRDIASLIMMDSAKIQAQDARHLEKQQKKKPEKWRKVYKPLYDDKDVLMTLDQFVTVPYHRPYNIAPGITANLFDAGHILGSALVRCEVKASSGKIAVGFTGDLGRKNMPILKDPVLIPPVDYLVCESTYGDRLHDESSFAEEELAAVVRNTAERGGKVIIPAFAIERTQEIVYLLHKLYDEGRIPEVPVYVDSPMAVSATAIFMSHPECYDLETMSSFFNKGKNPFRFDALHYVTSVNESKAINSSKEPCVIVATSGMCEAGRVLHHLIHGVGDDRNTVLIVGFMAANTLGRALADKKKKVRIFGAPTEVRATVKIINAFSAHADYEEMGEYLSGLDRDRLKGIFLVHGEPEAQAAFKDHLSGLGFDSIESLKEGRSVNLS